MNFIHTSTDITRPYIMM